MDALRQRIEDLLVPHGRFLLEEAVDDDERHGPAVHQRPYVTHRDRWQVGGIEQAPRVVDRQAQAEEDVDTHHEPLAARARSPSATKDSLIESSPGTTTLTTGIPISGCVRSTR